MKSQGSIFKSKCFVRQKSMLYHRQKSMLYHYYIQNIKDGIQIRVYNIIKELVTCFSQLFSAKVKKILRKHQAQFRENLRKLKLRQNDGFLIKIVLQKIESSPTKPNLLQTATI